MAGINAPTGNAPLLPDTGAFPHHSAPGLRPSEEETVATMGLKPSQRHRSNRTSWALQLLPRGLLGAKKSLPPSCPPHWHH